MIKGLGAIVLVSVASGLLIAGTSTRNASSSPPTPLSVGKQIFFDARLSEPAGTSCASCHDPAQGYAGNHGSLTGVAQGSRLTSFALRNTPSVRYLKFAQPFHFHWEEDAVYPDPYGGLFWDGRADTIASAVQQPLLNPNEMGNTDPASVLKKLDTAPYAQAFHANYPGTTGNPQVTMSAIGEALEAFLTSPEMSPFTSKYDDYIRGKATLTPREKLGLELFKNPVKGNCTSCHTLNDATNDPSRSLFTDYGFEAAGIPRNPLLEPNQAPTHFDLGLCDRTNNPQVTDPRLCGQFRTPSLRNVATRHFFMHNGVFTKLRDVVAFYATRDTQPNRWYPGGVSYDDVPESYRQYVNVITPPYNRQLGDTPDLDDDEIDAIVSFLQTLNDAEYRPNDDNVENARVR